jgi:hypothetical protein
MAAFYLLNLAGLETIHGRDSEICKLSQMDISRQASSTPSHGINSKYDFIETIGQQDDNIFLRRIKGSIVALCPLFC